MKKILTFAAVGSLGIHGLAWAISAVLPKQVIAEENAPIELLIVSEPEEELLEPEEPLEIQEPEPEEFELSDSTQSSSDFLTAAAQLAPEPPSFPEPVFPEIAVPEEIAAAAPLLEPTILVEPEPEAFEPEEVVVEEPEPLESEVEPEEIVEELEVEEAEAPEEIAEEVEEIEDVVETEVEGAIATEPALEEEPKLKKPSLLDKIKEIRSRTRQERETGKTATASNSNSDSEKTSSETTPSAPQKTAAGPSKASPGSSSSASTPTNSSSPSNGSKPGGEPIAASDPASQGSGNSNQPARQTIACRRCSKPKFSKRELEGAEGETQFEVITDARGRVVDVIVTQSSGSSAVDEKTVAHIKRRWRFESTSGGATVPVTVDMAVEGSDYYRERETAKTQERLEYEVPAQPSPVFENPLPTAGTSAQQSSPQLVDAPPKSTSPWIAPESVSESTPSQPQTSPEAESKATDYIDPLPVFETDQEVPSVGEPEPYSAPEPTYESLEPDFSPDPEPVYEEPYSAPEPAYEAPEPYYDAPEPIYEEPYSAPEPVYEEPYSDPEPVYEAPEPYYAPEPVYEEPYYESAPVTEDLYLEE